MGIYLFALIIGTAITLVASLIAGLKDNLFAAQMALFVGLVLEFGTLVVLILNFLLPLIKLAGGVK